MKFLSLLFLFLSAGVICQVDLFAKPAYQVYKNFPAQNSPQKSANNDNVETYSSLKDLQHEIDNHELELRMFEERLNTQETILDTLRQQFLDTNLANQQIVKGSTVSLEKRMSAVDTSVSGIVKDMRELQSHANDSAKALSQYKEKILDLEREIKHLQNAVESILTALQIDDTKSDFPDQQYEVKTGDSLGEIAKKNHTSVKKIKEVNGLTNDRIFVGQKLKLP